MGMTLIRFADAPVSHTLESKNGVRVLKINDKRTGHRSPDKCDANVLLLYNDHWGVVYDDSLVTDLGIIPNDLEQYAHKLDKEFTE